MVEVKDESAKADGRLGSVALGTVRELLSKHGQRLLPPSSIGLQQQLEPQDSQDRHSHFEQEPVFLATFRGMPTANAGAFPMPTSDSI